MFLLFICLGCLCFLLVFSAILLDLLCLTTVLLVCMVTCFSRFAVGCFVYLLFISGL